MADKVKDNSSEIWRILRTIAPFIILVLYILVCAGIFYAIEIHSDPNSTSKLTFSSANSISNFWQAIYFVVTLVTTIGYGDVSPSSAGSQLVAIVFSLIGIPLYLICLTHLGKWFQKALNKVYIRVKAYRNKKSTKRPSKGDDPIIDTNFVPLSVGIGVTLLWILFCSVYFYFTLNAYYPKGFSFFTAFYFTAITFLTIGLGDISPSDYQLILITAIFIMIGLALVSMCIDIVQTKLEMMFDNVQHLIEREYKKNLNQDGSKRQNMSNDPKAVQESVNALMTEDPNAKWFSSLMSEKNKHMLIESYIKKANMKSTGVQTETKQERDIAIEIQHEQWKPEPKSEIPSKSTIPQFVYNTRPASDQGNPKSSPPDVGTTTKTQNEALPNVPDLQNPSNMKLPQNKEKRPQNKEKLSQNQEKPPQSKLSSATTTEAGGTKTKMPPTSPRKNLVPNDVSKTARNGRGRNLV